MQIQPTGEQGPCQVASKMESKLETAQLLARTDAVSVYISKGKYGMDSFNYK